MRVFRETYTCITALLCSLLLCFSAAYADVSNQKISQAEKILITNVELLDTPNGELYNIAIDKGVIVDITRQAPVGFVPDEIIDGKGMLATAGMVNTHGHVSMTLLRSYADDMALMDWLNNRIWPLEAHLTSQDIYWGAMLGIAEMLKSGTTCFTDMYFDMNQVAEAVKKLGIRAQLSIGLFSHNPKVLQEADVFYDTWHGYDSGRIRITYGPHAPYTCDDAFLKRVIAHAKVRGAEIQTHLCETKGEVEESLKQTGKTPVERFEQIGLFDVGTIVAHAVHLTDRDLDILARKHVRVAHSLQSNMKLASGIARVPDMLSKNIPVGLSTDGAASNNNLDMLEEIRETALVHKAVNFNPQVISAKQAWELGTFGGAKVLGFSKLGKLQKGWLADIVLWKMQSPSWYPRHNKTSLLVYSANSRDVDTVFVQGKAVVKDGRLTMFDEAVICREADNCAKRLVSRLR